MTSQKDSFLNNDQSLEETSQKGNENDASPIDYPQIDKEHGVENGREVEQLAISGAASPTSTLEDLGLIMNTLVNGITNRRATQRKAITDLEAIEIHHILEFLKKIQDDFKRRIGQAAQIRDAALDKRLKEKKTNSEENRFIESQYSLMIKSRSAPPISAESQNANSSASQNPLIGNIGVWNKLEAEAVSSSITEEVSPKAAEARSSVSSTPKRPIDIKPQSSMRAPESEMENGSISARSTADEKNLMISVTRSIEFFQLGFTHDEVMEFKNLFEQYTPNSEDVYSSAELLKEFLNFISQNAPASLKRICIAFQLLEMGHPIQKILEEVKKK